MYFQASPSYQQPGLFLIAIREGHGFLLACIPASTSLRRASHTELALPHLPAFFLMAASCCQICFQTKGSLQCGVIYFLAGANLVFFSSPLPSYCKLLAIVPYISPLSWCLHIPSCADPLGHVTSAFPQHPTNPYFWKGRDPARDNFPPLLSRWKGRLT